jgi:hypothetical protein
MTLATPCGGQEEVPPPPGPIGLPSPGASATTFLAGVIKMDRGWALGVPRSLLLACPHPLSTAAPPPGPQWLVGNQTSSAGQHPDNRGIAALASPPSPSPGLWEAVTQLGVGWDKECHNVPWPWPMAHTSVLGRRLWGPRAAVLGRTLLSPPNSTR